ncbi:hypothetical protein [Micromonospora lupini]|uniref:Uncharacterized protein n=1 Tax=Micromonospora lupini str. Lupac 08 TaxID=1150864 RepID=I0L3F4_9ACTN|nr:hypothetical protein [Micromonospora lupini]CCH18351.1 membrane hypothetical protein [Micromonospora lupini str. Lupac 08]
MGDSRQPEDNRSRGIDARQAQGLQVGDHNRQYNISGPVVRSAYLAEVHRIAPAELLDRDAELARLAAFCTGDGPGAYQRWEAAPRAGMTALLSWFVLHPPPGVRIVSYFANAGRSEQDSRDAFVDVVLEQLVELTGGSMPGHLTRATQEAHLLGRYIDAAQACERRDERLVLVVDGLDARRNASGVATLLPDRLVGGTRVVLGTDLGWRAPADLPPRHPLRDRTRPHLLPPFVAPAERARRKADAARRAAERAQREAEAARREAEREQAAAEERRNVQRRIDEWQAAEAERLSLAARAAAVRRALTFVVGWTGLFVLLTWLILGWTHPGVAGILSAQLVAGGLAAAIVLVPAAFRLGAAYAPVPASPAAWIDRSRYGLLLQLIAFPVLVVVGGAMASDYLLFRHTRQLERSLGMAGALPSFDEVVAVFFLLLIAGGCAWAGWCLAARSARPWDERQRERERAYRAVLRATSAGTERGAYPGTSADVLSQRAADRARAYQDLLARLAGHHRRNPPR